MDTPPRPAGTCVLPGLYIPKGLICVRLDGTFWKLGWPFSNNFKIWTFGACPLCLETQSPSLCSRFAFTDSHERNSNWVGATELFALLTWRLYRRNIRPDPRPSQQRSRDRIASDFCGDRSGVMRVGGGPPPRPRGVMRVGGGPPPQPRGVMRVGGRPPPRPRGVMRVGGGPPPRPRSGQMFPADIIPAKGLSSTRTQSWVRPRQHMRRHTEAFSIPDMARPLVERLPDERDRPAARTLRTSITAGDICKLEDKLNCSRGFSCKCNEY